MVFCICVGWIMLVGVLMLVRKVSVGVECVWMMGVVVLGGLCAVGYHMFVGCLCERG